MFQFSQQKIVIFVESMPFCAKLVALFMQQYYSCFRNKEQILRIAESGAETAFVVFAHVFPAVALAKR